MTHFVFTSTKPHKYCISNRLLRDYYSYYRECESTRCFRTLNCRINGDRRACQWRRSRSSCH
ncbi:hypothetical protein H7U40_06250 [Flavonifractor plautii]|nr:hypothetical protein [Flavonifractor plautii]